MNKTQRPTPRLLIALLLVSCSGGVGPHVWVHDYKHPRQPAADRYVLAAGDVIRLRVFDQEQLSTTARVRADGKISVPLLNDVDAAGLEPDKLAARIQEQLKSFVKTPLVTVSVEEVQTPTVYVAGEVAKPGTYVLDSAAPGVLPALVAAGGLTAYARRDRIFVIREGGPPRIRFRYEALTRGDEAASSFALQRGDVVVVE